MTAKTLCVAVSSLVFTVPACFGQIGELKARFVYIEKAADDPAEIYTNDAKESAPAVKLPVSGEIAGEAVACPVIGRKIALYKSDSRTELMATVEVADGATREVVIFLVKNPKPEEGGAYLAMLAEGSLKAMPPGASFFGNLSSGTARVTLAEVPKELAAGKSIIAKRPEKRDDFNMAPVVVEVEDGGKWRKMKESMLRFAESDRYFILAYPVAGRPPAVKVLKQTLVTEAAGKKGR